MKIPSKRPFETILKKMSNLGLNQKSMINSEISKGRKSIVSVDVNKVVYRKTKKTFSVKFINYIEPYEIGGVRLTAFYTEVDSNLEEGDRVFIVGGNYDSDLIIKNDKFNKKSDGYIVQFVDRTKIVLDIEWIDVNPWNQEPVDSLNFLRYLISFLFSTSHPYSYISLPQLHRHRQKAKHHI